MQRSEHRRLLASLSPPPGATTRTEEAWFLAVTLDAWHIFESLRIFDRRLRRSTVQCGREGSPCQAEPAVLVFSGQPILSGGWWAAEMCRIGPPGSRGNFT